MKKQIITGLIAVIILLSIFLIIKLSFTGFAVYSEGSNEKIKLGYCPTMQKDAIEVAEEENYELIDFRAASAVLSALNNEQIDKGMIGRKAKQHEINSGINEKVIESGYTLVTNKKSYINYFQLTDIEIYTYLSKSVAEDLIPENSQIVYLDKGEVFEKIYQGKFALISWDDWKERFELAVVVNGNEKVKDFRGVFLYE